MYGPSFNFSSPASLSTPTPTFMPQPSRMVDTMRPTSPRSSIGRTRRLILLEMLRHSRKSISRVSSPTESRSQISGNDFHCAVQHVSASVEQASTYYQQKYQDRRHFGLMVKVDGMGDLVRLSDCRRVHMGQPSIHRISNRSQDCAGSYQQVHLQFRGRSSVSIDRRPTTQPSSQPRVQRPSRVCVRVSPLAFSVPRLLSSTSRLALLLPEMELASHDPVSPQRQLQRPLRA